MPLDLAGLDRPGFYKVNYVSGLLNAEGGMNGWRANLKLGVMCQAQLNPLCWLCSITLTRTSSQLVMHDPCQPEESAG